jgi:hypothetical protein
VPPAWEKSCLWEVLGVFEVGEKRAWRVGSNTFLSFPPPSPPPFPFPFPFHFSSCDLFVRIDFIVISVRGFALEGLREQEIEITPNFINLDNGASSIGWLVRLCLETIYIDSLGLVGPLEPSGIKEM